MQKNENYKFWSKSFFLLWQSQLVSDFGNAAFDIAIGFWVLEQTKSTGMMGLIMACFASPVVLLGPLAGAFADRVNRKLIIVTMDLIRGILFLALGLMVTSNVFVFWYIFPIAIISGVCTAFFSPAISASIPDLVRRDSLTKANSLISLSQGLSQMIGISIGGLLYAILKAPFLFIIDGISFLFAAVTQTFLTIPIIVTTTEKKHILSEMVDGLKYVWHNKGIRLMLLTAMIINFFAVMGLTLFAPLFAQTESLGVKKYGIAMGTLMLGNFAGMILLTVFKIKSQKRFIIFSLSAIFMDVSMILTGFSYRFFPMLIFAFLTGTFTIIINIIFQTAIQITTPQENRGKVFGIFATITGALVPISMALCGVLAQIFGVRNTIIVCFIISAVSTIPLLFNASFKDFISFREQEIKNDKLGIYCL